MKKAENGPRQFRYQGIWGVFMVFLLIAGILFAERSGIQYEAVWSGSVYLKEDQVLTAEEVMNSQPVTCLAVMDSENAGSRNLAEQFSRIFMDMKVGYDLVDVSDPEAVEKIDFSEYETVVVILSVISPMKEKVPELGTWVKNGGNALFAMTLERESYLQILEQKLGIISAGYSYAEVDSIHPSETFMIGGGRDFVVTDPFESAWGVELSDSVTVHAWTGGEKQIPLVWENSYGKGKFVAVNLGIYDKAFRGFYAAAYSLLTDCAIYPVINGSAFYLDDFPAPVPSGNSEYIRRDYKMSVEDFYTNVWWPDLLNLASEYGIRYTGVIIETYGDETDGTVVRNMDAERFEYFGNMLLHQRGELGYHGYNHQPLSLGNVEYGDVLPYHTWESEEAMARAISELIRFEDALFPTAQKSVYVPPSNVLSEEGRKMLGERFVQIKTIASNYFSGDFAYQQEFEVAKDGIVEQPRIISGCILDDYMKISALSELNMHFVNNHFMHPDDLLDEDRGAKEGWETLKGNLKGYMEWLYGSAPSLRNLTGSELSGAIQRYAAVGLKKETAENEVRLQLENFYDEAYFFVRFNEGKPGKTEGGELEHLTGDLYLLRADKENITIEISR